MGHPSWVSLQIVGDIRPSEDSNVPFEFFKGLKVKRCKNDKKIKENKDNIKDNNQIINCNVLNNVIFKKDKKNKREQCFIKLPIK